VTRSATILAVVCAALVALPAASTAAAASSQSAGDLLTIRWVGDEITRIGSLNTASTTRPPTIARAITAFGRPTSTRKTSRVSCTLSWSKIGLHATFVSLGGAYPSKATCVARLGVLQTATVLKRKIETQGGLLVGDSVARLKELHPEAYFQDGGFWLATAPAVLGSESRSQRTWIVRVLALGGKVYRIGLRVGAAGK
jgi:hypothetical protein